MEHINTAAYWINRYKSGNFPWNLGEVSHPMKQFIDKLEDKSQQILIPGAGYAHEAAYLCNKGFTNVHVLDWAPVATQQFKQENPDFPESQVHTMDFFDHEESYGLILEQTFFCALPPPMRANYAAKMAALLKPQGKLAGVFFDFPLTEKGPPFGGSSEEYEGLFKPYFNQIKISRCTNSNPEREGVELWLELSC